MTYETFFRGVPEHEHKFIRAEEMDEVVVMRCSRVGCTKAYIKPRNYD